MRKNAPVSEYKQVQTQRVVPIKQSSSDNFGKEEYLNDPDVENLLTGSSNDLMDPGI